jgi:hypothetical protein
MVNRGKRDLARQLIEKFLAAEIANDDFVDNYPCREKEDRAVVAIYERLWGYWDDRHTHKLTGKHELNPEGRALFERCIAFLNSDLEYEWPAIKWWSFSRAFLRKIGLRKRADDEADQYIGEMTGIGKFELWPFVREEDLARGPVRTQKVC